MLLENEFTAILVYDDYNHTNIMMISISYQLNVAANKESVIHKSKILI
jgi:hypothetical protein